MHELTDTKPEIISPPAALSPQQCGPSRADLFGGGEMLHNSRRSPTCTEDV